MPTPPPAEKDTCFFSTPTLREWCNLTEPHIFQVGWWKTHQLVTPSPKTKLCPLVVGNPLFGSSFQGTHMTSRGLIWPPCGKGVRSVMTWIVQLASHPRGIAVKLLGLNGAKKSGHGVLAKAIWRKGKGRGKYWGKGKWKTKSKSSWISARFLWSEVASHVYWPGNLKSLQKLIKIPIWLKIFQWGAGSTRYNWKSESVCKDNQCRHQARWS